MPRTSTSFTKGDPRAKRGGRKPLPLDVIALCRAVTREAIEKQIEIMRTDAGDDPAIMGVQARVTESLLNRGWGPPTIGVKVEGEQTVHIKRLIEE